MTEKKDTNQLIEKLVEQNKPLSYKPFIIQMIVFLVVSFAYLCIGLYLYYGFRIDIQDKIISGKFLIELFSATTLVLFLAYYVKESMTPQGRLNPIHITIAVLLLIGTIAFSLLEYSPAIIDYGNPQIVFNHMHCAVDMSIFAIPLSVIGFFLFKKGFSTYPGLLGFSILTYSALIGYLVVRMSCSVDAVDHHGLIHITPLIFYSISGYYIGNKILKK